MEKLHLQSSLLIEIADRRVDLFEFLGEFLGGAGANDDEGTSSFCEQIVRPYLREYQKLAQTIAERLRKTSSQKSSMKPASKMFYSLEVFISHSSDDRDLAEALVGLLRSALNLNPNSIRCTSVPGYKLPLGADTDEKIRSEILDSRVLIGLLTPTSLKSSYVLFELGARWGKNLFIGPLLAKGAQAGFLRGPITGFNALQAHNERDMHQFLEDVAKQMGSAVNNPAVYSNDLKAFVSQAGSDSTSQPPNNAQTLPAPAAPDSLPKLSRHTVILIKLLGQHLNGQLSSNLSNFFKGLGPVRLRSLVDDAAKLGLITESIVDSREGLTRFQLTAPGREILTKILDGKSDHQDSK